MRLDGFLSRNRNVFAFLSLFVYVLCHRVRKRLSGPLGFLEA